MDKYFSFFNALLHFFSSKLFHKHHRLLRKSSNSHLLKSKSLPRQIETHPSSYNFEKSSSTLIFNVEEALLKSSSTLIFIVEEALLKSSSLFPYFMLVAFEAGGLIRALMLLLLYPLVCLVGQEFGLKIMVMVCFFGIKKDGFRAGSAVLPKFLLEDVGLQGFEIVRKFKRKVGVSSMPQVMVESFLRDYLEIDFVVGRDLKVFHGYFIGLMEEKKSKSLIDHLSKEISLGEEHEKNIGSNMIGFCGSKIRLHGQLFSICKEIYPINEVEKSNWRVLPVEMYPKPLIFHDGRLATRPTLEATFAMLMWAPFGFILALLRGVILSFPAILSRPILHFMGMHVLTNKLPPPPTPTNLASTCHHNETKGNLYVCNHKTLLDPVYLYLCLGKPLTAVTYSLSKVSEMLAPIKTVRLSRNRDQDAMMMEKMLKKGDLAVCPEGTTCREPYLLRFSPLFAEMSDMIVPVALDCRVTMFYGTTASGLKCLDPLFFLMNPKPSYTVQLLEKVQGSSTCCFDDKDQARFHVANLVQAEMGKALDFECTKLTRKDKYLILAGNDGISH